MRYENYNVKFDLNIQANLMNIIELRKSIKSMLKEKEIMYSNLKIEMIK